MTSPTTDRCIGCSLPEHSPRSEASPRTFQCPGLSRDSGAFSFSIFQYKYEGMTREKVDNFDSIVETGGIEYMSGGGKWESKKLINKSINQK